MPLILLPFGLVNIFGQQLEPQDLAVIGLLIVLEGVLSIDNALVLGLLAKRLPPHQRAKALTYGLIGAFVFRFIAIFTASLLLKWTVVKLLGGGYLVYIAVKHLFFEAREEDDETVTLDASGHPIIVDAETGEPISPEQEEIEIDERVPVDIEGRARKLTGFAKFWPTVFVIEMTDVAFAVDSILAAIALVGPPPPGTPVDSFHPKLWVVITGGILGVILMRFAAAIFIKLLEKFPRFEVSAYLLVIVIGMKLLLDWAFNSDWSTWGWSGNHEWAVQYVEWMNANWIFKLPADHLEHPHLLNFHDLRRPECITFWLLMLICFAIGFIPKRKKIKTKPATKTN